MTSLVRVPHTLDYLPAAGSIAMDLAERESHTLPPFTLHAGRDRVLVRTDDGELFVVERGQGPRPIAEDTLGVGPGPDGPRVLHADGSIRRPDGSVLHAAGTARGSTEVWGLPQGELIQPRLDGAVGVELVGSWSAPDPALQVVPTPGGLVRARHGAVDCLRASDGARTWEHRLRGPRPYIIAVVDDVVWCEQRLHDMIGLDLATGELRHQARMIPPANRCVVAEDGRLHSAMRRVWGMEDLTDGARPLPERACGGPEGQVPDRFERMLAVTREGHAIAVDRHAFVWLLDADDPTRSILLHDGSGLPIDRLTLLGGGLVAKAGDGVLLVRWPR